VVPQYEMIFCAGGGCARLAGSPQLARCHFFLAYIVNKLQLFLKLYITFKL
jgi:hypothetical protein